MLPEPKSQHQLHYKILSRFCPTLKRSPNAMKAFSQHQLHYKILSRLCTTLQRSPNASRAPISTPTALQNSFKVLPYITKVPKCHKSLSLNTKCTKKCITKFCPTLERSQNDSKACVSTPSAQQKFTQGSALHDKGPKMLPKAFVGFAYQGKDIVFRFIIECSNLRDFGP